MKIALYALFLYIVLAVVLFIMQRRLLYFPSTTRPSEEIVQVSGLLFWPASDEPYRGLVTSGPEENPNGTIIIFHGNVGRAVDRSYYVQALAPLGYRVLLAEYPGYGGRPGSPSEAALVTDAKETIELAQKEFDQPVYLWGESLGCGVVTALAAESTVPIAGVVLLTPWDSLPRLAQSIYWYFPTRWLVLDTFDNVNQIQTFSGPVAVVLAGQDEIIPNQHSQRLYDAIPSSKQLWVFENAGHNSWPIQPDEPWWGEVMDFVSEGNEHDKR